MQLAHLAGGGRFALGRIAEALSPTREDVARSAGLGRDAVSRQERLASPRVQTRLREMVEILHCVEPRFGSAPAAYAWYRSEPRAGFDGATAMALVADGRAHEVMATIDAVDAGVHA